MNEIKVEIYSSSTDSEQDIPLISSNIQAGFPSPALDFIDLSIDLNKYVVKHPSSTFYGRVQGDSMKDAGIGDGDLLVIDKGIEPSDGKIAICFIDGEFTLKRIKIDKDECWLAPANENYKPIKVSTENNFMIWGIVTFTIKSF